MAAVHLLLGSNKGNRESFILNAVDKISQLSGYSYKLSSLYKSEPWGFNSNTWFYNMAMLAHFTLPPLELLSHLQQIERELGRVKNRERTTYQSREIDIDIIFYGSEIFSSDTLSIPHPRMEQRRFVLEPLSQISPNFVHPLLNKSVKELLEECPDNSVVIKL